MPKMTRTINRLSNGAAITVTVKLGRILRWRMAVARLLRRLGAHILGCELHVGDDCPLNGGADGE